MFGDEADVVVADHRNGLHAAVDSRGDQVPASVIAVEVQHVRLIVYFESQIVPSIPGSSCLLSAGLKPHVSSAVPKGTRLLSSAYPALRFGSVLGYQLSRPASRDSVRLAVHASMLIRQRACCAQPSLWHSGLGECRYPIDHRYSACEQGRLRALALSPASC